MSVLRVTIPGDYWDVQIYRGKLHLWTMSGSLITIDWDHLVDAIAEGTISPLAVRIGLAQGAALYGEQVTPLRTEPEFYDWLVTLFNAQAEESIAVGSRLIAEATLDEQDNPLHDLPVDTEIYDRKLYAATDRGIWKGSVGRGTIHPVSTRFNRIHDLPAVSIRARSHQLALAATGSGLFKLGTAEGRESRREFAQLSDLHCDKADWVFQSIFAASSLSGGYLVSRYWETSYENFDYEDSGELYSGVTPIDGGTYSVRTINGALESPDASWAYAEKIYTARERRLTSSLYTQKEIPNGINKASTALGEIELSHVNSPAIAGGAAVFGTVIEFDDRLLVVQSDETQLSMEGPITRWKTYPRAMNYENHLHVILEDHLEVFAFYKDYFVDQRIKRFGVEYQSFANRRARRRTRGR